MFDKALDTVGIDRRRVYVTNAVKHFKFEPRGKKRIHQKPNAGEITACRFWVNLEREFVRPKLIVALGATAVHSLMGKAASISSLRGKKLELPDGGTLLVTVHPSYLLRMPDREKAAEELKRFEADLQAVKAFIDRRGDEVRSGGPLAAKLLGWSPIVSISATPGIAADVADRGAGAAVGDEAVDLAEMRDADGRRPVELGRVRDEDHMTGVGDDRLRHFHFAIVEVEQRAVGVDRRSADDSKIDLELPDEIYRCFADHRAVRRPNDAARHGDLKVRVELAFYWRR